VAGHVPKPGIFRMEDSSAALEMLIGRAGGHVPAPGVKARIVRTIHLRTGESAGEPEKDFYCHRVDLSQASRGVIPVYDGELLLVEGPDTKPIYVAIMPHFVLQLEADPNHPIKARDIIEELGVYWPAIRQQEIGLLRCSAAGRASKLARRADRDSAADQPLQPGDVLYVDGHALDRVQSLAAADALAELAGIQVHMPGHDKAKAE
jgi:hypothetical protein